MQLEKVAVALRPRQGWEAVDLGFRMAAHWARPLWTVWFVVVAPLTLALVLAFAQWPYLAALLLWVLKPLYDRFLLHVLSRAVFGEVPTLAQTLSSWREILTPALWWSLLSRCWDYSRSFLLPVVQLERQTGKPAAARRKLLKQRASGHANGLTIVCLHFEAVVIYGLYALGSLFETDVQLSAEAPGSGPEFWDVEQWWSTLDTLVYIAAVSLIEPFYVAAGFALYLNRRVMLEGWDIELALRRITQQLPRVALLLVALVTGGALAQSSPALATGDDSALAATKTPGVVAVEAEEGATADEDALVSKDTPARAAALEVLADPAFGSERRVERWVAIDDDDTEAPPRSPQGWWRDAFGALAELLRLLAWVALAVLIVAIIWAVSKRWTGRRIEPAAEVAPTTLFGLAIAPESLPVDIPTAARAALAAGQLREALSLLYRGALSYLVHQRGLRVGRGATEGDVLTLAQRRLPAGSADYFAMLLPVWVEAAYGGRLPDAERVSQLCDAFDAAMPAAPAPAGNPS